jgi:hypothetical protein
MSRWVLGRPDSMTEPWPEGSFVFVHDSLADRAGPGLTTAEQAGVAGFFD